MVARFFFWFVIGTIIILVGPIMASLVDIFLLLFVLAIWLGYYLILSSFLSSLALISLIAYLLVGSSILIFSQTKYGGLNLSYSEFQELLKP